MRINRIYTNQHGLTYDKGNPSKCEIESCREFKGIQKTCNSWGTNHLPIYQIGRMQKIRDFKENQKGNKIHPIEPSKPSNHMNSTPKPF